MKKYNPMGNSGKEDYGAYMKRDTELKAREAWLKKYNAATLRGRWDKPESTVTNRLRRKLGG